MDGARHRFLTTRQLVVLATACAVGFGYAFAVIVPATRDPDVDRAVAGWVVDHRTPALTAFFQAIALGGSVFGVVPLGLVVAGLLRHQQRRWRPVAWLAAAMIGATAVYLAFNLSITRVRPPLGWRLHDEIGWSFPSGHSTQAVAFWFMTAILLTEGRPLRTRVLARLGALVMVLLVGGSRIYLGAHWTSDVASGFMLGACWLSCVLVAMRWSELPA